MGSDTFSSGMRKVAGAVSVVTTIANNGQRKGLTATAVCSLSAKPPSLIAWVNRKSRVAQFVPTSGVFAVNVPSHEQEVLARTFSGQSELTAEDRFSVGKWRTGTTGAPILKGSLASFECRLGKLVEHNSHMVLVGNVVETVIGDRAEVASLAHRWHGRLDILVNNAGIINRTTVSRTPRANWEKVLKVNLTGALLDVQAVSELVAENGGGAIVHISSSSPFSGHHDPASTASKWRLRCLTRSAAMELVNRGIRVNAVCPGLVVTGLNADSPHLKPMIGTTPIGCSARPEEIAELVFLVSDVSSFITGEDFGSDGGFTAGTAYRHVARETGIYDG